VTLTRFVYNLYKLIQNVHFEAYIKFKKTQADTIKFFLKTQAGYNCCVRHKSKREHI